MDSTLINERGFWMTDTAKGHAHDPPLREELISFCKQNSIKDIVDFGCGPGYYFMGLKQAGFNSDGYDGNPNTPLLTKGQGKVLDLTVPFTLERTYDCVLCLEVGEHIPKNLETIFLSNIVKHTSKWLILSWATPNQNGDGHVNCQTNDYIEQVIGKYEFTRKTEIENRFRSVAKCGWFKNTIMVFEKNI